MPFQALAAAATLLTVAPHGNRIELRLDHGSAELLWVSPATFRFRRTLEGPLPKIDWTDREPIAIEQQTAPTAVRLRSHTIEVTIQKRGVLIGVRKADGTELMQDVSDPVPASPGTGVSWQRRSAAGEDFYGLGPRTEDTFSLRGKTVRTSVPFLVSTTGYGESHNGEGAYRFDFTQPDRYRIEGFEVDYYFYSGATPKKIFEEHNTANGEPAPWSVSTERFGTWAGLKMSLVRILEGAMSAATAPAFGLAAYETSSDELKLRARQLGSLVADVTPGQAGVSGFRSQLETFYGSYLAELRDRGFPVWHPLPFQFPGDREAVRHTDEFLLGDEMLVAPIVEPGGKRSVYLPRGSWTNLETNKITIGPQTVSIETQSLPVWAKNGSIIPLNSRNGIALHYFPKAGGEFFLLESDIAEYSQAHAAPALDFIRLQIESRKDRDYQWVVHHIGRPASVEFEEKKFPQAASLSTLQDQTWFYEPATQNLNIRVKVPAGEDRILNVTF